MVSYEFCVSTPAWPGCDQIIADHEAAQAAQNNDSGNLDGDMDDDMEADPLMGQLTYTLTAVAMSANALLKMTRYSEL